MALQIGGCCHYHPMRAGIGVCVTCRQVICSECTTQYEGINRCAACLARLGQGQQDQGPRSDWRFASLLGAALVFGLLFGSAALAAHLISP